MPVRVRGLLLALLAILTPACTSGPNSEQPTAAVSGRVTYRGQPVTDGSVLFIPKALGPTATGELQRDGTFTLTTYRPGDGAVLGTHTVVIAVAASTSRTLPEDGEPPLSIPTHYTSRATTDLEAAVVQEENRIHFDLKDEPSTPEKKQP